MFSYRLQSSKAVVLSAAERRQSAAELATLLVPMRSFFLSKAVAYIQRRVRPEVGPPCPNPFNLSNSDSLFLSGRLAGEAGSAVLCVAEVGRRPAG